MRTASEQMEWEAGEEPHCYSCGGTAETCLMMAGESEECGDGPSDSPGPDGGFLDFGPFPFLPMPVDLPLGHREPPADDPGPAWGDPDGYLDGYLDDRRDVIVLSNGTYYYD